MPIEQYTTQAECARIVGVSGPYLSKAYKQGRLKGATRTYNGKRMYDPDKVAVCLQKSSDPERVAEQQRRKEAAKHPTPEMVEQEQKKAGIQGGLKTIHEAKKLQENLKAATMQIEYNALRGKFIDAEQVDFEAAECATKTREALLALPSRLRSVLAVETDAFKIEKTLETEIRTCLQWVSKAL